MMELDADWWQWLAENRLMDHPPDSIIAAMVRDGFDRPTCERAIAELDAHPVMKAARNHQQLHRKLESVVSNLQAVWQSGPDWDTIEKRRCPPRDEFEARYLRGFRPVVLTDFAADWPARERWAPARLKERFGSLMVEVQTGREDDPEFEENKDAHREQVRFGDFLDRIVAADAGGDTNDCYLTANNELLKRPEFASLLEDIGTLPPYLRRDRLAGSAFFWVGPRGSNTPLHHDTVMLFHAQLIGRKRWRLVSPLETPNVYNHHGVFSPVDLDAPQDPRHPRMKGVRVLEVVVEAGETLFLPLGWWHQVSGLATSVSISLTNLDVRNDYRFQDPVLRHW